MAWGSTNVSPRGKSGGNSLFFSNIVAAASLFTTYTPASGGEEEKLYNLGYIYKANVPVENCLAVMTPDGTLSLSDVKNAGVAIASQISCYDGGICLYATGVPANNITVLNLELGWSEKIADVEGILTPSDIGAIPASQKGVAGGVASLGADGLVPVVQLPSMDYIPTSEKGAAGGVASLNSNGKLAQMPTAADVGAAPAYTYGTEDIEAGSASTEPEGSLHFVIE